jgi:hypothetical protein
VPGGGEKQVEKRKGDGLVSGCGTVWGRRVCDVLAWWMRGGCGGRLDGWEG